MPSPTHASRPLALGAIAAVTIAGGVGLYHLGLLVAPLHEHNAQTFFAFETLGFEDLARAWRSRVLSLWAADAFGALHPVLPVLPDTPADAPWTSVAIAQWLGLWGIALGAIWLAARRERALFPILGTYACVAFGYSVGPDLRVYPWDLPALAVFTAVVALVSRQSRPIWLALAIWLGMAFKETAIVLALVPFALPLARREQLAWAGTTAAGCLLLKVALDLATGNDAVGLTMASSSFYDEGPLWWWNLRQLPTGVPLLVNAGTLLAFLLLPGRDRALLAFKAIAGAFAVGNLLFGVITEYRIWFEMIPLALFALDRALVAPAPDASRAA